jgi:tetratricopeptide (TPR) repeat protein
MLHLIIATVLAATASANATWYQHYETGVRLVEQGQAASAVPELEAALKLRSGEGVQVPTEPQQYIDYLPHLYLAMASQMSGDLTSARKHLAAAESSGVAAKSEVGHPLLVAYQLLLRGDGTARSVGYATYDRKPGVLSDAEFNTLRNDVMEKCNLPAETKSGDVPWYANYELGLALERKGDYPRALAHFIDAVANRPNPQKQARMYGMWLIDYYPYFHIARSHVRLENWQCANNALEISQRLKEIPAGAPELSEALSLRKETQRRMSELETH